MKIIVMRHGQRNEQNDELSLVGMQQSRDLAMEIGSPTWWFHPFSPTLLLSSPKRRCQQTLSPLATTLQLPLTISSQLDERRPNESGVAFSDRIHHFISGLEGAFGRHRNILLCSHFDWLAEFVVLAPSDILAPEDLQHFSPGEKHGFLIEKGTWYYRGPKKWA